MKRAQDWQGDLSLLLEDYRYQPTLTAKLDALPPNPFDQSLVNEIVLWKVNRYAPLDDEAFAALERIAGIKEEAHRTADADVRLLLRQAGVDLPMASTLMRFRNPSAFQIIDRHAYRALTGDDYPLYSASREEKKVDFYFDYLDRLFALAKSRSVAFKDLDRILYIFDKKENGTL